MRRRPRRRWRSERDWPAGSGSELTLMAGETAWLPDRSRQDAPFSVGLKRVGCPAARVASGDLSDELGSRIRARGSRVWWRTAARARQDDGRRITESHARESSDSSVPTAEGLTAATNWKDDPHTGESREAASTSEDERRR
uniref:Uncharacterized protein n=1 Tax=Arundo donax TaxID=35708 RepID=A0A0A9EIG4_ARUDO